MTGSPQQHYYDYLAERVIAPFYNIRLEGLNALHLHGVLKRKNPYLFKAKNIELAGDFVKGIVDAFLSSQEETIFGNLLEGFAIYVSASLYGGFKSAFKSVDLEFRRNGVYHIVGIKSGINWGNADQINGMKNNFKAAKEALRRQGTTEEIVAVNGCMYGRDRQPLKNKVRVRGGGVRDEEPDKVYYKYAGQDFWRFISDDDNFYREIIVPIDREAKQKDENFKAAYAAKVNEMTQDFMLNFITDNQIDWIKLVDYVSGRDGIRLQSRS
ncbi:MAG TPA: PmeII family type II restriction endonuclease [Pyrinomonadaceae bacterium]|jgi:site-specific DNA-methyltransferase (cytosine-N4-specific)|nr:PmeII family type II restriction endonuclease [Pyrinomonadaceae bacterium]